MCKNDNLSSFCNRRQIIVRFFLMNFCMCPSPIGSSSTRGLVVPQYCCRQRIPIFPSKVYIAVYRYMTDGCYICTSVRPQRNYSTQLAGRPAGSQPASALDCNAIYWCSIYLANVMCTTHIWIYTRTSDRSMDRAI